MRPVIAPTRKGECANGLIATKVLTPIPISCLIVLLKNQFNISRDMKHIKHLVCAAVLVTLGFNTRGDTIYDNYGNYNGNSFSMTTGLEIGNQIAVSPGIWTLTNFSIMYYTPSAILAPNVGIELRFYNNDGAPSNGFPTPGTMFYDSGWFYNTAFGGLPGTNGYPSGFHSVYYNTTDFLAYGPPIVLPATFTFTITFTNLGGTNIIDLPLANNTPPISVGDYWHNNGSGWTLATNAGSAANLVVDFSGTVPEPSTFGLAALGSALLLGVNKLRRKQKK